MSWVCKCSVFYLLSEVLWHVWRFHLQEAQSWSPQRFKHVTWRVPPGVQRSAWPTCLSEECQLCRSAAPPAARGPRDLWPTCSVENTNSWKLCGKSIIKGQAVKAGWWCTQAEGLTLVCSCSLPRNRGRVGAARPGEEGAQFRQTRHSPLFIHKHSRAATQDWAWSSRSHVYQPENDPVIRR